MALVERSVRDLIAAFSSTDPTPGGGSASALASSVGAALLIMVAGLPKTRDGSDEDRSALASAAATLLGVRTDLVNAIDADTAAYDQVVAAYRLPKASPEQLLARGDAIQRALRLATDVPLSVLRLSAQALEQAGVVAAHGHRAAASDVGVAAALLRAGAVGARLNVEINIDSVSDLGYGAAVRAEVRDLSTAIDRSGHAVDSALRTR
jgi:formiminotetrahydrofolate cyclodeaminase